jgi:hypothetical protein
MICTLTARRLKPGAYDDLHAAWTGSDEETAGGREQMESGLHDTCLAPDRALGDRCTPIEISRSVRFIGLADARVRRGFRSSETRPATPPARRRNSANHP